MSNETEEIIEENFYSCLYCGAIFDTEDERDDHTFRMHMNEVEEKLSEIRSIGEQHSETISEWKAEKKKELLLRIATERPQLLHEIQCSPHSDEMLDKMVEEELFKTALNTKTLSSFDLMWIRHPKFEEVYKATKYDYKQSHQPDAVSGQSDTTIPEPDSPSADKKLREKTPVNIVTFKDGKLILTPEYEPDRLPRNVKYAGNRENLSEEDRHKMEMILVLQALLRKKKSN
jgi:hypothetical protein